MHMSTVSHTAVRVSTPRVHENLVQTAGAFSSAAAPLRLCAASAVEPSSETGAENVMTSGHHVPNDGFASEVPSKANEYQAGPKWRAGLHICNGLNVRLYCACELCLDPVSLSVLMKSCGATCLVPEIVTDRSFE